MTKISPTIEAPRNYRQLHDAMQLLASWCDGAQRRDGFGFDQARAHMGHVLARTPPEEWSLKMARIAWRYARHFRRQLTQGMIDAGKIEEPKAGQPRRVRRKAPQHYTAELDGERLRLTSESFPGWPAVGAVKSIIGRDIREVGGRGSKEWVTWVPLESAGQIIAAVEAGYIVINGEIRAALAAVIDRQRAAIKASRRVSADVSIKGIGGTLRPFQGAGVSYIGRAKIAGTDIVSTFVADQMGLGKTVQALVAVHMLKCRRTVVVVPASLKLNWAKEARKWIPGIRHIEVVSGVRPYMPRRGTEMVIINYDLLAHFAKGNSSPWVKQLERFSPDAVILDESHYCKNPKAQRTIAVKALARLKSVRVRLALTGTPIENGPIEFVPQLQILGRLKDLGGWQAYVDTYCIPGAFGGFSRKGRNLGELNTRMRAGGFYLRRCKADVLTELPPKVRVRVPIQIDRKHYNKVLVQTAAKIEQGREEIKRAKMAGVRPPGWAVAAKVTSINALRKAVAYAKLKASIDWCKSQIEQGEKLIIFAHYTDVVSKIAETLNCPMIYGKTPNEDRQAAVERFQTDKRCMGIALNLKAGGVGHTLTASTNVVFVESGLTPGSNDQCEDRAHRIGQVNSVTAWYLEAEDTIDQWVFNLVDEKRETVDQATDGSEAARESKDEELEEERNTIDRLAELIEQTAAA